MSKSLTCSVLCLAVLAVAGCRQQPAEPAASPAKPAVTTPAAAASVGNAAEERALQRLQTQLQRDRFYPDDCISIMTEQDDQTSALGAFEFAVHERHGDGCPGDPQTSPVRDRFRVQADGRLLWYDVVNGDFVDYAEHQRSTQ
ncbi:hypothetical protein GGR75_003112 [Xanthomonas campestris]|uniref:hypothetical protein n=1 Tax=Xanthomonas campestris TaxID=339 RepID=UPI002E0801E4|nr:hypothetical protein [Xanthomonas campestris]